MSLTLQAWNRAAEVAAGVPPEPPTSAQQRQWDDPCCKASSSKLTNTSSDVTDRARHLASQHDTSGVWFQALPILSLGLRLSSDATRIAVCLRLGLNQCQPHTCHCGASVDATGELLGMQEKCWPSLASQSTKRCGLACTNLCPNSIHEGTRWTEQDQWKATERGYDDTVVTRAMSEMGRHVTRHARAVEHSPFSQGKRQRSVNGRNKENYEIPRDSTNSYVRAPGF